MARTFANWKIDGGGIHVDADLMGPLDDSAQHELRELFARFGWLVFKGQRLTLDQQIAVMSALGPVLRAPDGVGFISTDEAKGELGSYELAFHSDLAFTSDPYKAISLLAVDVVDGSTSTFFVDGVEAYRRLPADLKERLADLELTSVQPLDNTVALAGCAIDADRPRHKRPAVINLPNGEPCLYVSKQQSWRFEALPPEQSNQLLERLFSHLYDHDLIREHVWHVGDLVIWNNLRFQHARRDVSESGTRTLQRVVVADKSFYELCPQFSRDDPQYREWLRSNTAA